MDVAERPFRIAHLSDLHCGGPYFEAALLERAISEINELRPDMVICTGDLTTFGFKHEYQLARQYLDRLDCDAFVVVPGNHDARNVGYVHFEELFGNRASVLRKDGVTVVAVDSTEPDLDHGQIGRGRYPWIEEQFAAEPSEFRIFVLHHHLLPVPGTGRERNVVYDAGDAIECLLRARVHLVLSGHKHVPYAWRLENLFVVNTGTVSSLRLRGNTRPCYNVVEINGQHVSISRRHPFHGEERIIQFSTETFAYEKYTGRIEEEVTTRGMRRVVAIVDGEHYPPVVRAALEEIDDLVVAAVLVGGTEKLRGDVDGYGVPLEPSVEAAIEGHQPDLILDLSDEPVLGPPERLALAGRVLALGVPYEGSDFRFDPPSQTVVDVPTLAVIGTGKRVGKTAVTGHVARRLASTRRVVVVAMGRGGPPEPEVVVARPTVHTLLDLSRSGRHAASDHLETAVVAGVTTVGCRRCGGGLAGAVAVSNVVEGARVATGLGAELVVLDGSGAALPPVAADRRVLVASAAQPVAVTAGYLNAFRARIADLVVITMAEDDAPHAELRDALRAHVRPWTPLVRTVLRPRPLEPVDGASVAFFCTAPPERHARLAAHLEDAHGARVTSVSGNLSDRGRLREDIAAADADVFLVELKAAAVDVVAEEASRRGVRVVVAANDIVPLPGEQVLDDALDRLAAEAVALVPEPARAR